LERTSTEVVGLLALMAGIAQVLVTGSHTAQADFRHYLAKHRAVVGAQIVG
jgi:hypothetical protein